MGTGIGFPGIKPQVLVIGATQGTGCQITSLLLQEGYRVRALARNEAKAKRRLISPVEVVLGDITKAGTLPDAIKDVDHVIFTAGVTQRPAAERLIIATEFSGVITVARNTGFNGRFLYIGASEYSWLLKTHKLLIF